MTYLLCGLFLYTFALLRHNFVHGYEPGGLLWRGDHDDFIPIVTVSGFEPHRHRQELSDKIRKLENHNFQGEIVRLGYFQDDNMVNFYENNTKVSGVCGEIWNMLADYSNFTLVVSKTSGGFGRKIANTNNTFDGVMGLIKRHEIDIVPRVGFSEPFSMFMNFTTPIWKDKYRFYIRPVWKTDNTWMFRIFTYEVWCSIFTLYFLLSTIGYSIQRIPINATGTTKIYHNFHDYLFHTYATFCGQGMISDTFDRQSKIFDMSKRIFAWMLLIVLSSTMVSLLSDGHLNIPFQDIESLLNYTNYYMVMQRASPAYSPFTRLVSETTGDPQSLDGSFKQDGPYSGRILYVPSRKDMYKLGCWAKDRYAIFGSETVYAATGRYICKLVPAGIPYLPTWVTFGVIDGFKYKRTFDIGILKLKEFGLITAMKRRWVKHVTDEMKLNRLTLTAVNIEQVSILFVILFMGMIASVVILVFETIVFSYNCNRH